MALGKFFWGFSMSLMWTPASSMPRKEAMMEMRAELLSRWVEKVRGDGLPKRNQPRPRIMRRVMGRRVPRVPE